MKINSLNTILAILLSVCSVEAAAVPEKVVATVNGIAIGQKRVDREVRALIPQSSYHATVTDEKKKELEKKAIDQLINKELLSQEAKNEGIVVSAKELSDAEETIVKGYSGRKNLLRVLTQAGMSENDLRYELMAELSIGKLYKKKIEVAFSDNDLKEYYEKNKYKFKEPEKINVQMIYTRNDPEIKNGGEIAKKRINDAMAKIKAGDDFELVAEKYSNDMTRVKGGNLGMIHKGRIENVTAENVAFALKKGETSSIVETDIGYFIFHLIDRKDANQLDFKTVKEKLRDELKTNREKEKMEALLDALKKQSKITR
ncbi:MAG: peptidylprolyl isomerase [Sulfuricurvum sp.]|uniref:peptidylprolyl isomerase n=1 Tax=Sulfuricurvum sp. TaxID=2025608 RepID=UPI0025F54D01|nr:peptidylprolyl isomerase [Sulfuricurvum sp.]MCK9373192.1 peptidylprolyl isomerase [Sulfuricurvum sp.]